MKIIDLIDASKQFISLEFFPPKERASWPKFYEVVEKLNRVNPLFVSVTYGAGGGTQDNTLAIVTHLKNEMGIETMAHLTCVGASSEKLHGFMDALKEAGIENVLALRGDPPKDDTGFSFEDQEFRHASDLVRFIRGNYPEMGVGVVGYPEPHPESPSIVEDIKWTKNKVDQGGEFVITQLFFDNRKYFDMVHRLREMGMTAPVIPGVLPIMSIKSAKFMLSLGGPIPGKFMLDLEKEHERGGDEAVRRFGLDYATRQAQGLIDGGAPGVHLYTLNQAGACLEIVGNLKFQGEGK